MVSKLWELIFLFYLFDKFWITNQNRYNTFIKWTILLPNECLNVVKFEKNRFIFVHIIRLLNPSNNFYKKKSVYLDHELLFRNQQQQQQPATSQPRNTIDIAFTFFRNAFFLFVSSTILQWCKQTNRNEYYHIILPRM